MSKRSRNIRQRSPAPSTPHSEQPSWCDNLANMKTFETVAEIFKDKIEYDVIRLVLEESEWKEEAAVEKLIQIATSDEPKKPQVDLAIIACSLLEDEVPNKSRVEEVTLVSGDCSVDGNKTTSTDVNYYTFDPEAMAASEQSVLAMYDDILQRSNIVFSLNPVPHASTMLNQESGADISLGPACCNPCPISFSVSNLEGTKDHCTPQTCQTSVPSSNVDVDNKRTEDSSGGGHSETHNTCAGVGLAGKDNLSSNFLHNSTLISSPSDSDESSYSSSVQELESLGQNQDSVLWAQVSSSLPSSTGAGKDSPAFERTLPVVEQTVPTLSGELLEYLTSTASEDHKDNLSESTELKSFTAEAHSERGSGSRMEGIPASESEQIEDPGANSNISLSADAPEFVPTFISSSSLFISRADCFQSAFRPVHYSPYPSRIIGEPLYSQNAQYLTSQVSSRNVALKNLVGRNLYHTSVTTGANRTFTRMNYSAAAQSSGQTFMGSKTSKAAPPVIDVQPSAEVENVKQLIQHGVKVMVIMRGLPGSGKSHLARQVQGNGQVFSTDDYFLQNGVYCYCQENLTEAHDWNKKRVRDAVDKGISPVIVDNTNIMIWELLPYAQLAHARGYEVEILESNTPWKWQPKRLAKYNCHGVSIEAIKKMKDRFEILDTARLKALLKNTKRESNFQRPNEQVIDSTRIPRADQDKAFTPHSSCQGLPRDVQNQPVQQGSSTSETRIPPSLSKNKKRAKKLQGEASKTWECIHDLLQRGATDEEIDSIIYISQFTDAEKQEIQSRRKSLKISAEGRIKEDPPDLFPYVGRPSEQLGVNKGPMATSIESVEGRVRNRVNPMVLFNSRDAFVGSFEADRAQASADRFQDMYWEDPKPQRRLRTSREQRTTEVDKSMENNIPDDEKAGIIDEGATNQIPESIDVKDKANNISKTDSGDKTNVTVNTNTSDNINLSDKTDEPPFQLPQTEEGNHSSTINAATYPINHKSLTVLEGKENLSSVFKSHAEESRKPTGSCEKTPGVITVPTSGSEDSDSEVSLEDKARIETQTLTEDTVSRTDMLVICSLSNQAALGDDGCTQPSEATQVHAFSSESFHTPEEPGAGTGSNSPSMPDSPRKKTRRRKHKTPAKPFLDDSIKQQLHKDSWKAFTPENQIMEVEMGENNNTTAECFAQKVEVHTASSQTEVRDFSIAFMVETTLPDETALGEGYHYLRSNGQFTSARPPPDVTMPGPRLKQMLDKGTSVDVMLEQVEPNLEILQNCFPEVAAGHLKEVLDVCQGDMEWATNLILDWGVSTPFTTSDKHLLRQEMARHQMLSSAVSSASRTLPGVSGSTRRLFQPVSLFELCQRQLMVRAENTVIKDDVQRQVIRSGYQRLQCIQSVEQERAKNISWDEESVLGLQGGLYVSSPPSDLFESAKEKSTSPQLEQKRIKDLAEEVFSLSSSQSSSKSGSLDDLRSVGADFKELKPSPVAKKLNLGRTAVAPSPTEFVSRETQTVPCIDTKGDLSITVSLNLIKNLEHLFGPLPLPAEGSNITLTLDTSAAQHLYACLSISLSKPETDEELSRIQQLKEDEALAQRLQSLEDSRLAASRPVPVQRKQPKKAAGRMVPMKQSSCPVMLQDIMEEEMARQVKRESMLKQLESTGSHLAIATKLKREKLYKHFPGIDELFLEEIFQANGYCLETTVSVIEGALGHKQPVSHRLDMPVASSKYLDADVEEQENIEIAKQQSIFNLINNAWNENQNPLAGGSNREEFDYNMLRQESYVHHRMRTECFEKAQEAYRRGMRDVAIFYSQEGHRHTQLMQEANMRASQKILEARRAKLDQEMVLDLHGLHTDEAITALKKVLAEKEKEFQQKPVHNRQFLYVITGRGKHSLNGVSRLRPAVTDYLSSSGHRFVGVHTGMLKVTLHPTV